MGAAMHAQPVLGCPNPIGHIPGNDIAPLKEEARLRLPKSSPAWRVHAGGDGAYFPSYPSEGSSTAPTPHIHTSSPSPNTPTFPKQRCTEG